MRLYRILLDPQGGEGSGGNEPPKPSVPDLAKAIEGLLQQHGDPNAALRVLLNENYGYRDQIRDLKGKVPSEGAVVLSGDDARRWHRYRELGDPSELGKAVSERDQYRAESERFRRAEVYTDMARVAGWNARALTRLAEQDGLDLETKEVKEAGKTVEVVHVKGVDGDGKPTSTPLAKYAETHWPEFLPALKEGMRETPRPVPGPPPRRQPPTQPQNPYPDTLEGAMQAIRNAGVGRVT